MLIKWRPVVAYRLCLATVMLGGSLLSRPGMDDRSVGASDVLTALALLAFAEQGRAHLAHSRVGDIEPLRQIAENAGHDGAVVSGRLLDKNDETWGFNASTDVYENLVAAGVIDPTKVVRTALQDAASVAGLLITTEAAISEKPDDKPAMGGMPGGGMGGMGGMDF